MNDLIEGLAKLSPESMKQAVAEAKILGAKKRRDSIPPDEVARLKLAQQRLELGQKISYRVTVPIQMDFTIKAEHEYGNFSDIDIKFLIDDCVGSGKVWLEYLKEMWEADASMYIGENCPTGVDKKIAEACDEESGVYRRLREIIRNFEDIYEVDAYTVIDGD